MNRGGLQIGVSVSKRHFKKAVERNRIKRLLREAYRVQKNALKNLLVEKQLNMAVFITYTGRDLPESALIHEKMKHLIAALTKIAVKENPPAKK